MHLSSSLHRDLTQERYNMSDAQYMAHLISFGPVIFQTARLMLKYGLFDLLNRQEQGLSEEEMSQQTNLTPYAIKCLLEASLTVGTVMINPDNNKYRLSKMGWVLLNDPSCIININFNHYNNYKAWFALDKSLEEGQPIGLQQFGNWKTLYEGLSSFPEEVKQTWLDFDHFYSDEVFNITLDMVFNRNISHILDIGGNTGRFAMRCVQHNPTVEVTLCDLPQQIKMLKENIKDQPGADRIHGYAMDVLDEKQPFPANRHFDIIWMSQFLDCFSEKEVVGILQRVAQIMTDDTECIIVETLWDRQKYLPAALDVTQISLYFTSTANGNSKMFNTDDLTRLIKQAGLRIDKIHDNIGKWQHAMLVCKK